MASKKGTNTSTETAASQDGAIALTYGSYKVADARNLPPVSLQHLLTLGFSTALKNSIAGVKAGLKGESKTDDNNWTDEEIIVFAKEKNIAIDGELRSDAVVQSVLDAYQSEMFESILSGTYGSGARGPRGPRLSPDEKLLREVAIWHLENICQKSGKAMPKNTVQTVKDEETGTETKVRSTKLDDAVKLLLGSEKHRPVIDAEFDRRKTAAAQTVAPESDDFLSDLLG